MNKPPDDGWLVKGGSACVSSPRLSRRFFFFIKQFKKELFVMRKRIRFCVANKNIHCLSSSTRPPPFSLLSLLFVAPRISIFLASPSVCRIFFSILFRSFSRVTENHSSTRQKKNIHHKRVSIEERPSSSSSSSSSSCPLRSPPLCFPRKRPALRRRRGR